MELKDQILQTKERKKGFLKAMPESTREQINFYQKLDRLGKRVWFILIGAVILSVAVYLVSCLVATPDNRWVVHAILAGLWVIAGIVSVIIIKSVCDKGKKVIRTSAQDYVEELNAINARLAGLEKAEKQRIEAEKQEAKAKARAEAAQREAEAAQMRQQAVQANVNANVQSPVQQASSQDPQKAE